MAWLQEATEILRILINDLTEEPTYEDNILEQTLLVAARYVAQEINFTTDYTVSFINASVTPDPSSDLEFINFTVLKAACLTNQWNFNQKAMAEGIKAKCGPAELTVSSSAGVLLGLIEKGPCKTYDELKQQSNFGNIDIIRGILTPFASNTFLPSNEGFVR